MNEYTQRGFKIYTEFKDTYGKDIEVVRSSSVEPRVWIQNEVEDVDGTLIANAHLSPYQALRVANALLKFVEDVELEQDR